MEALQTTMNIDDLALRGQEINRQIKQLQKELEEIKSSLREFALKRMIKDGTYESDALFDFEDTDGSLIAQVRFPPSSFTVDEKNVSKLRRVLGDDFERVFDLVQTIKINQSRLNSLSEKLQMKVAGHLKVKSNTPRVSFK